MWNWWRIQEANDYGFLSSKVEHTPDTTVESGAIYETIYDEFIVMGGLGEQYEELLEMKRTHLILRCEWLLTDDKATKMDMIFLGVDIEDKERTLNSVGGVSKEEALIIISENIGSHISPRDITVGEFYEYLNHYKKKAK